MTDKIEIEINDQKLSANKGQMLIEVADENNIYIPRFCYHKKLTVAANCRMCLVDVEKAPKPLPACATPVMDGMQVRTKSALAIDAQKSVMEFLLINHPLDCPICDQGGECELQDLAMGYGKDVSRYQENKRVVKDKDIGALVQTDMTRCIHCTRCVRFGEEIAGVRELGATGRGEHMQIGTYIEKAMTSEMSANIIDLCPVGALTSKPFRYAARTWELSQHKTISAHDCVGSNMSLHIKGQQVKRVVPLENETLNETWLADRDRFSYQGLYHKDRLLHPMIKKEGKWEVVDWQKALELASHQLLNHQGEQGEECGVLASPNASVEEHYLLQKVMRALGINNLDHRLQQYDFDDSVDTACPQMHIDLLALANQDAILLLGADCRTTQPIINHRIRQASLKGAKVMSLSWRAIDSNYDLAESCVLSPNVIATNLVGILKALNQIDAKISLPNLPDALLAIKPKKQHELIAEQLHKNKHSCIILGHDMQTLPDYILIKQLANCIAIASDASLNVLSDGANSAGAYITGMLPVTNEDSAKASMNTKQMLAGKLSSYLLLDVDPVLDCLLSHQAKQAMQNANCVIALSPYKSETMLENADILLPIALFAETSGHKVNLCGDIQAYTGAVNPPGEARPAWKILRVLANHCGLPDFEYTSSAEIYNEFEQTVLKANNTKDTQIIDINNIVESKNITAYNLASYTPIYSSDALLRHSAALQATGQIADEKIRVNTALAKELTLNCGDQIVLQTDSISLTANLLIDDSLADNCIVVHSGQTGLAQVDLFAESISVKKA